MYLLNNKFWTIRVVLEVIILATPDQNAAKEILPTAMIVPRSRIDYCNLMLNAYVCVCVHRGLAAGIYTTNNPEACHFVADNCKANIIVVEDQKQLDKILEVSVAVTEAYFLYLTS